MLISDVVCPAWRGLPWERPEHGIGGSERRSANLPRSTEHPRPWTARVLLPAGAESQNRTGDTAIFSRVLYQLSYLGLGSILLGA